MLLYSLAAASLFSIVVVIQYCHTILMIILEFCSQVRNIYLIASIEIKKFVTLSHDKLKIALTKVNSNFPRLFSSTQEIVGDEN